MQRRLAAIMAADVVGYSSMMGSDEAGVLSALKTLRSEIFDPIIARHHGRLVKLMGDCALVEFASVVDAVTCGVEIQRAMAEVPLSSDDILSLYAQPLNPQFHCIAWLQISLRFLPHTYARRCSCRNHVPGLQRHKLRQMRNDGCHPKMHRFG